MRVFTNINREFQRVFKVDFWWCDVVVVRSSFYTSLTRRTAKWEDSERRDSSLGPSVISPHLGNVLLNENTRRDGVAAYGRIESGVLQPGKLRPAVGHATTAHATPRTTMPREPGNKASRPRNLSRVPRPMVPSEPGNIVPRPAEKPSTIPSPVRPHRPTMKSSGHDRSDTATTRLSGHDRPNAAVDPKPFLKPNPHNSSPKPAP
ncbi:unnamed protein product [Microthlaspi erraticum]|uniref:Uncharacterized protein n=1 Tax=Microthlaspi erraticum TaxID=1685480 RepID=A0A6D2J2J3_9BRAS|nr:unnamed protein product [Microthlaspi erraticum]